MSVQDTLAERAKTYGDFKDIARISGDIQRIMRAARNWDALPDDMREALQTIASKIARVLNGDCEHIDSWHDIAGYATLVADRLRAGAEPDPRQPALSADPPLATPPEGYEVQYFPFGADSTRPWRARLRGHVTWAYGKSHADALLQAGYSGG